MHPKNDHKNSFGSRKFNGLNEEGAGDVGDVGKVGGSLNSVELNILNDNHFFLP
jgi:hypothetical protein